MKKEEEEGEEEEEEEGVQVVGGGLAWVEQHLKADLEPQRIAKTRGS